MAHRFVDRDMLMRFHWGLGVGHTYSHFRDGAANQAESTQDHDSHITTNTSPTVHISNSGISRTLLNEFDDLNNDFSLSDLDWELPGNDYWETESESGDIEDGTNDHLASPDEFIDPGLSLTDLDALSWEVSEDEEEGGGDGDESDDDTDASEMDEMYGSDRGDGDLEGDE